MAEAIASNPSGLTNVAQLINSLAPIFIGSGPTKTTESSVSSFDPNALRSLFNIANTAQSNANDPTKTDNVVQNIMKNAAAAFAPTIAASNSAGLYNSTTLNMLAGQAQGNATAAASSAVLNYQTSQQQLATNALTAIEQGTRMSQLSNMKLQAPAINPVQSLLGVGGGILANKLLGTKAVSGALDALGTSITDALGLTNSAQEAAASWAAGLQGSPELGGLSGTAPAALDATPVFDPATGYILSSTTDGIEAGVAGAGIGSGIIATTGADAAVTAGLDGFGAEIGGSLFGEGAAVAATAGETAVAAGLDGFGLSLASEAAIPSFLETLLSIFAFFF